MKLIALALFVAFASFFIFALYDVNSQPLPAIKGAHGK